MFTNGKHIKLSGLTGDQQVIVTNNAKLLKICLDFMYRTIWKTTHPYALDQLTEILLEFQPVFYPIGGCTTLKEVPLKFVLRIRK